MQLLDLLRAASTGTSVHAAWQASSLTMSLRSACRWLARWHLLTAHVRARLYLVVAPPGKADDQPDPLTLRHLAAAFPEASCPIAAFQSGLQTPITG